MNTKSETKPLIIDNFGGAITTSLFGNINSGRSWTQNSAGQNPFVKPGQLTWANQPSQIDPAGAVITDLIVCGRERVESGILYVYMVGHTGRVYKVQVNDPTTYNPDYDNPVLLATLTINSPTFTRGGSIDFFGTTQVIVIGHDMGATTLHFDGSNEAFLGTLGSWTQNVPRPIQQFVGRMYLGNGNNLAETDATNTVTTYAKLSPGFPSGTQVRDLDLTPDGIYLEAVVSSLALSDITATAQDTTLTANAGSYIFKWNGSDVGSTAVTSFPSFSLASNTVFQNYQYTFGTDQFGSAIYKPNEKILAIPEAPTPLPNAVSSTGNLLAWMAPLYFNGVLEADFFCWGSYDFETGHPVGWWDLFFVNATAPETDIIRVPCIISASNTGLGSSSNNYAGNIFGTSKIYFSTLETSSAPTTKYRFYKWEPNAVSPLQVSGGTPLNGALYQTQTQMFSKKVSVSEVRVYGESWIAGNSFSIDLTGSNGEPITGGSQTFTASAGNSDGIATNGQCITGNDYAWYGPDMTPSYALGVRITNLGTTNFTINKIEIDTSPAGK